MVVSRRGFLGVMVLTFACLGSAAKPKPPRQITDEEFNNSLVDLNFSTQISSFLDKDFNPHIHYQSSEFQEVDDLKELRKSFSDLLDEIQNHLKKNRKHTLVVTYKSLLEFMNKQNITLPEYLKEVKPKWLENSEFYMDNKDSITIFNRAIDQCCICIKYWLEQTKQLFVKRDQLIKALFSNPA
jgi:hypothetical protein